MTNPGAPKHAKWPFLLSDLTLLITAAVIVRTRHGSLDLWQDLTMAVCVALGAVIAVAPFLLEFRAATKAAEAADLADAARQIQNMDSVAADIAGATSKWQAIHEQAAKAAQAARETADRMRGETLEFRTALAQANDGEKARLKLEIDKLRRAESDWLQVVVRLLDNTFVLYQAAVRSHQPGLIEQISQFQNVSRDAARRVGLAPFAPRIGEPFDGNAHEPAPGTPAPAEGLHVAEVIATGYTFQGQLVRRSLVVLARPAPPPSAIPDATGPAYVPPMPAPATASPEPAAEAGEAVNDAVSAEEHEVKAAEPAREEEGKPQPDGSPEATPTEANNTEPAPETSPAVAEEGWDVELASLEPVDAEAATDSSEELGVEPAAAAEPDPVSVAEEETTMLAEGGHVVPDSESNPADEAANSEGAPEPEPAPGEPKKNGNRSRQGSGQSDGPVQAILL